MLRKLAQVAVGASVVVFTPSAFAKVEVSAEVSDRYSVCVGKFRAVGLGGLVDQLEASSRTFKVKEDRRESATKASDKYAARDGSGSGATIGWNFSTASFRCEPSITLDTCASLFHEMRHAADMDNGANFDATLATDDICRIKSSGSDGVFDTTLSVAEVEATRTENKYRTSQGLALRTKYGTYDGACRDVTASGPCIPPPKYFKPTGGCNAGSCSVSAVGASSRECEPEGRASGSGCDVSPLGVGIGGGDPHSRTFDGVRYDFHGVGEFVVARSLTDNFQVQARQGLVPGITYATLYSAIVAKIVSDRVSVVLSSEGQRVTINGVPTTIPGGFVTLSRGGSVASGSDGTVELRWPDGSELFVHPIARWGLTFTLRLADTRRGKVEGLFGNFDGLAGNDLLVRGAAPTSPPVFAPLYPVFADSWRVGSESLFDYGPGETTETFTDRSFPTTIVDSKDLPGRGAAEAICRAAGIVSPQSLIDCIFDVAVTGQTVFAADIARLDNLAGAGAVTLNIAKAGESASLDFAGNAGEKIFVQVHSTTLPDDCTPLKIIAPDGIKVGEGGCLLNQRGFVDTTVLPVTGTYRFAIAPSKPVTGRAMVSIVRPRDDVARIALNGPEVTAISSQPGESIRFTFDGVAAAKVSVEVSASTLADDCSPLKLTAPDGSKIADGCVINGKGGIDSVNLPVTGTYSLWVDPTGVKTGRTRLRLRTAP